MKKRIVISKSKGRIKGTLQEQVVYHETINGKKTSRTKHEARFK